jgi:hypothetical protein
MRHSVEVSEDGTQYWYNEDRKLDREDGPAILTLDGHHHWYRNGKLHREDGPAVEWLGGTYKAWYRYDKLVKVEVNGEVLRAVEGTEDWLGILRGER